MCVCQDVSLFFSNPSSLQGHKETVKGKKISVNGIVRSIGSSFSEGSILVVCVLNFVVKPKNKAEKRGEENSKPEQPLRPRDLLLRRGGFAASV